MTVDQPTLFPLPGRPGAMSAPVATLGPLTSKSSLSSAATSFQGYMLRQGFSENTVKAFMGDLRLFMKYTSPKDVYKRQGNGLFVRLYVTRTSPTSWRRLCALAGSMLLPPTRWVWPRPRTMSRWPTLRRW